MATMSSKKLERSWERKKIGIDSKNLYKYKPNIHCVHACMHAQIRLYKLDWDRLPLFSPLSSVTILLSLRLNTKCVLNII